MLDELATLPDEPDRLKGMVTSLAAELKARDILIEKLKHHLAGMRRGRLGARGETLDQLQLALEEEEVAASAQCEETPAARSEPARQPVRKPIPDHVPRHETELMPAESCIRCDGSLKRISEHVTQELEYVPGRFIVNRIARPKLSCTACETIHQAPLPARLIERGRPKPGLLAHVLVSKYADHLPLNRQAPVFEREGIDLDRSTLADWVGRSTALLEPLADAIGRHLRGGQALFADDTPLNMLSPGAGKTKSVRLWADARVERLWSGPAPPAA